MVTELGLLVLQAPQDLLERPDLMDLPDRLDPHQPFPDPPALLDLLQLYRVPPDPLDQLPPYRDLLDLLDPQDLPQLFPDPPARLVAPALLDPQDLPQLSPAHPDRLVLRLLCPDPPGRLALPAQLQLFPDPLDQQEDPDPQDHKAFRATPDLLGLLDPQVPLDLLVAQAVKFCTTAAVHLRVHTT